MKTHHPSKKTKTNPTTSQILALEDECLFKVFSFLHHTSLTSLLFVNKRFHNISLNNFKNYYLAKHHLALFLDSSWKAICDADAGKQIPPFEEFKAKTILEDSTWGAAYLHSIYKADKAATSVEFDVEDKAKFQFVLEDEFIPHGSPLCPGTLKLQYEMIQESCTLEDYIRAIRKRHGTPTANALKASIMNEPAIDPYYFVKKVMHEAKQPELYLGDHLKARWTDQEDKIFINSETHIPRESKRFEVWQTKGCMNRTFILNGLYKIGRRGGALQWEPSVIEEQYMLLRNFIKSVLDQVIQQKFQGRAISADLYSESHEDYVINLTTALSDTNNEPEELQARLNTIDKDLKVDEDDIADAIRAVTGAPLIGADKTVYEEEEEEEDQVVEYDLVDESSDSGSDSDNDENLIEVVLPEEEEETDSEEEEEDEEEEENLPIAPTVFEVDDDEDVLVDNDDEYGDRWAIDESETEALMKADFNADSLGDSLHDRLLKVSIQVHEQYFGKERTHKEKLHLKNWFGYGLKLTYHQAALENDKYKDQSEPEEENEYTEEEMLERDAKEDMAYYGYVQYREEAEERLLEEDNDSEQTEEATDVEALNHGEDLTIDVEQFNLQWEIKYRSWECIHNYFNEPANRSIDPCEPTLWYRAPAWLPVQHEKLELS